MEASLFRLGAISLALLGVAATAEPGPEAVRAELPFESARPNRIAVDLGVENSPHRLPLIVDTGASHSFMSPGVARKLGVSVRAAKRTPYRRATRVGRDLAFFVDTSTSDTSRWMPEEYGLLGGNFLRHYVVELDFARRRVRLLDPERYRTPEHTAAADEAVLPLQIVSDRPHLEIRVAGRPIRVLLDTGDPFGLSLLRGTAVKHGITSRAVRGLEVSGLLGPLRVELGEAGKLELGPFEISPAPVLVHEGSYNQGDASGAALGVDLLAQFDVRIDYPRKRLWLRRRHARTSFFGADYELVRRSGAHLEQVPEEDDAIFVRWILPDTPAVHLGLQPGDWVSPLELREQALDLQGVHGRVEAGGPLAVVRRTEEGWVEIDLERP